MTESAILPVYEESLLIDWLFTRSAVTDLTDQMWTVLPKDPSWPAVRANRVAGRRETEPMWLDHPLVQFDVWGGSKSLARQIADTIAAEIGFGLVGVHDRGVVTAIEGIGGPQWLPDASYSPARPRWQFDVAFTVHPNP